MVGEKIKGTLVYQSRISNVKGTLTALKDESLWSAIEKLAKGFGSNNRTLVKNITGGIRSRM